MNVFVINAGSSSIKYQLFQMPIELPVCSGLVERIGEENAVITHKVYSDGKENVIRRSLPLPDHQAGLLEVKQLLTDPVTGVIRAPSEIEVVGHRVVHGGENFSATTIITDAVKDQIRKLFALAPLHNPPNLLGIEVAEKLFEDASQVAVFDTAFHQGMPDKAYRYALPTRYYTKYNIRAYGFHGTSHKFVSDKAAKFLENPAAKIITIHLGNGCSMAAIHAGKVVDTSMGFGPMGGLVMGTRAGDIDPSIIFYLIREHGLSADEVNTLLNKQSGMLGLTGSSDMRDVLKAIAEGSKEAALAYELYAYRIKKYIGAYAAIMNGLDAIVFTAGVGENDPKIRATVCHAMDYLGITIDNEKNVEGSSGTREISKIDGAVKVFVIPTNEEWEIARQCYQLITEKTTTA